MAEDNEVAFDTAGVSAMQDNDPALRSESDVVSFVQNRFKRAEDVRQQDEQRWLKAYRNYRGLYGPDVQFTETEKSRVFVKVTKTKTVHSKLYSKTGEACNAAVLTHVTKRLMYV